jgi:hypothetical protein
MIFATGESDKNPVAYTNISIENNEWYVAHHMQNGDVYYRHNQYNMRWAYPATRAVQGFYPIAEWRGYRISNSDFFMDGVVWISNGRWHYNEQVIYKNKLVGETTQDCGEASERSPPPSPVITAQAPTTYNPPISEVAPNYDTTHPDVRTIVPAPPPHTNSASDDVPILVDRNEALVMAIVGGRSLGMTIDTGASQGSLPTKFADTLIADGAATEGEPMKFKMANGNVETNRTVVVNTVVIGSHTIHNVRFGVGGDEPLLGFNALSAVGTFKIDPVRGVLSFS